MKDKIKIELDKYEMGIVINALNSLRNSIKEEKGDTTDVDDILLKIINENDKKTLFKSFSER